MTERVIHLDRTKARQALASFLTKHDGREANLADLFKPLSTEEERKRSAYLLALLCLEQRLAASAIRPSDLIP